MQLLVPNQWAGVVKVKLPGMLLLVIQTSRWGSPATVMVWVDGKPGPNAMTESW